MRTKEQLNFQAINTLTACLELSSILDVVRPLQAGIISVNAEEALRIITTVQIVVNDFVLNTIQEYDEYE